MKASTHRRRAARLSATALAVLCLLGIPRVTVAAQDADFSIQVLTIRGTKADSDVSPAIKALADELKKSTGCTGFKLEKTDSGKAAKDKTYTAQSAGTYKVTVTPTERKGNRVTLKCVITRAKSKDGDKGDKEKGKEKEKPAEEKVIDTTITVNAGESQPFTFAYPGSKDDRLVIAISAK